MNKAYQQKKVHIITVFYPVFRIAVLLLANAACDSNGRKYMFASITAASDSLLATLSLSDIYTAQRSRSIQIM